MRLDFEVKEYDLYEFYKFHEWYSPDKRTFRLKRRAYLGTIMFLFPFGFFAFTGESFSEPIFWNLFIFGLFLFAIGFFMAKQSATSRIEKWVDKFLKDGKNQDLVGQRVMEFNEDGIECRSQNSDSRVNIKMIEKIRWDEQYYFIYLTTISAYVIPKRIFKNQDDKKEFEMWIEKTTANKMHMPLPG